MNSEEVKKICDFVFDRVFEDLGATKARSLSNALKGKLSSLVKSPIEKTARELARTYKMRKDCGDFVPSSHGDIVKLLEKLEEEVGE